MKKIFIRFLLSFFFLIMAVNANCWGFYGHGKINYCAVFLLPPEMIVFYKPNIEYIEEHATDPDKRRYAVVEEAPRHYIDIDFYGKYPYDSLPRKWKMAVSKYSEDTLKAHGIVPWHIQTMLYRLTDAFQQKNFDKILKNSAEIGHYIADAHVPLHTSSNHNGQRTNQKGIHGFWESRVPELLAETDFNFFIGKAVYINNPEDFIWNRILESASAVDSVLSFEKQLTLQFSANRKYAYEKRNGKIIKQYSTAFTKAYNKLMDGMIERRMRQSIFAIASFWYTAWVNAGQPELKNLAHQTFSTTQLKEFENLNLSWRAGSTMIGREE